MVKDDNKQEKMSQITSQLGDINHRIEGLEQAESNMLENLQRSINEHNRLLSISKTGQLDMQSLKESKQRLNFEFGRDWQP